MSRIIRAVDIVAYSLLTIATCIMVVSIFLQVVFRYVVGNPLFWSEEISRYAFIWVVFIGASIATKRGSHIGVDYFTALLNDRQRYYLGIVVSVLLLFFCATVVASSVPLIESNLTQKSPAVRITMAYIFLAIPVGFSMMFMYTLEALIDVLSFHKSNRTGFGEGHAL